MFESLLGFLHHLDLLLLYFFNIQLHNPFFDFLMPIITFAGTQIFWIIISIILLVFFGVKGRRTAFTCLLALVLGYFLSESLKAIFQVPRPFEVIWWVRHSIIVGGYSMPSGHSVAAFSGFMILGIRYGRLPIFIFLAVLVGISRIYMGLHYPSDVIVGALLGILCALVSIGIEEKFFKSSKKYRMNIKRGNQ
ncbi:MAG TPA: phosphatase PAP2 family protein [Methanothermobacter sp.]|nr:phosphatase PAP2 family protein [Methanothermobacter sp.]HOL69053.1 phosphatase PAP2 family protein [Methanothermobacter sp.]HPU36883.1 phosphatase PAP2 family protein [Methanothermobacter sp.]